MGGDEFCVVTRMPLAEAQPVLEAAAHALCEHGQGFAVTSTWGAVSIPDEATSVEDALRIADERMYEHKRGGRLSLAPTVGGPPGRLGHGDGGAREHPSVSMPPAA
jgi:GGDEF domain-containing protein